MPDKKTKVVSKNTIKTKGKSGGKFTQNMKAKAFLTSSTRVSKLKQSVKRQKSKSSFKSVKKNKDGSYTLQKGKDGGNFTEKKISNARGKRITKRYKKITDNLKKRKNLKKKK